MSRFNSYLLHSKISGKGMQEQLKEMFGFTKKATKQTKGKFKYNDARHRGNHPEGLHPDYSKKKKRYY